VSFLPFFYSRRKKNRRAKQVLQGGDIGGSRVGTSGRGEMLLERA
jgi:hypothetical protein